MQVSERGVALIRIFEGCSLTAYQDIGGVWTIGYGHIEGVKMGDVIEQSLADAWLFKDIHIFEKIINDAVQVALTQEMFDALISLVFNIGGGNFRRSTLRKKLNQSDYFGASQEFQRWIYVKGEKSDGLIRRREKEKQLFTTNNSIINTHKDE